MRCMPGIVTMSLLLAPAAARADGIADPARSHPSIHARELQHWNSQPARDWQHEFSGAPRAPAGNRIATQSHHILGFHPYWMGTKYLAYDWSTLHTVVFFSLEIDAGGGITDGHGWPWVDLVTHAHAEGARVLIAATQFSSADLTTLLGSAPNRSNAVMNIVNAMVNGNADGVCLDFEAIPGSRKQQYVDFADELRTAMTITNPQSQLVITTPAVDWNNAYDYDELAARGDFLLLMAYDYHWSGSSTSGPVAPLEGWGTYNVSWSIQDHLLWGAPADKLLLGVPYYGYRWNTTSSAAGATTTSTGTALIYAGVQSALPSQEELWDAVSQTPWMRTQNPGWQQTWFDDATSLAAKYQTVSTQDLAGVGIWALGYDDPYTDLWNALHAAFDEITAASGSATGGNRLRLLTDNPFAGSVQLLAEQPQRTSVRIYDIRGRLVQTLQPQLDAGGRQHFVWDGRTTAGSTASRGVYLAVSSVSHDTIRLVKTR